MILVPQLLNYRVEHIINAAILSINSLLLSSSVSAQIVPDGTLNTQVNLIDGQQKIQKITGGIESESRTNLFHSFKEFSPTSDFVTYFDNNNNIQNIFTRVTGGSSSLIDGLIKANGSASLFILNPSGIIFGNNAQLALGGSFIATTAESIIFADGTKFDTQLDQTSPLLTVSIPSGLQYGNSPGAISSNNTNSINLNVSPENTIAFLGGNIELQNISIEALSGNVEISGVAEGKIVSLFPVNNGWKFSYENASKFNDITISQQSQINTTGELGTINLRGKDIFLNPGSFFLNDTDTDVNSGGIYLLATNHIELNAAILSTQVRGFDEDRNPLPQPVQGKGGNIQISAKDLKITNGSVITSSTVNEGAGGNITLNISGSLELSELMGLRESLPSLIISSVGGNGEGGTIEINTNKLVITDGTRIDSSSFGQGKAGNIFVNARESILVSGSSFGNIFGRDVTFNSGLISSSGFEDLPLEFQIPNLGESGSLLVNTPQLSIEDGGEISVSHFGRGNSGDITINVGELLLNNDSQITATSASGNINSINGSINVTGSEIILKDNATIAATAKGDGNGANINITANNLVMFDDSSIDANAVKGSGGNITITTQSLFTQNNPEEVITATALSQLGINGIVTINTPNITSRLGTTQVRRSLLAAEESIYTGCSLGTDFSANKFSYIGRGGMRKSPFESVGTHEFIGDLGLDEWAFPAAKLNTNKNPNNQMIDQTTKSIIEATTWIVNAQGNVELIAQASNDSFPSDCLFK